MPELARMKLQSSWHFDSTCPAALGNDSYTPVCIFDADFTDAINQCTPIAKPASWGYGTWGEAGGIDYVQTVDNIPIFKQMADYLGLVDPRINFHNQTNGQMMYLHVDNIKTPPDREPSVDGIESDCTLPIIRRFVVMLADWEMGQAWMFGNAMYHQWVSGTCITWDLHNMPHDTVNAGWKDRPLVQITGTQTARTLHLLQLAESNLNSMMPVVKL
jgi:hypothetical protein